MIITFIITFVHNHLCIEKNLLLSFEHYCNLNKQFHFLKKGDALELNNYF